MGTAKHRIAVLDALRDLACLIVFNEHITANLTAGLLWGHGADDIYTWTQLPFVRIWFCGMSVVAVLVVNSEYVLAYRPLRQAHFDGNRDAALHGLASSIFR